MLKDSGTQRAELFTEHLNSVYAGSQTAWIGPPDDASYIFEMRGANKRIVVHERVFELWGGSKPGLQKTLAYYKIDEHIAACPPGSELHVVPGNGEKPEFQIKQPQRA
jgi:hypothetical protein